MKIFAKRKRKTPKGVAEARSTFASGPVVEKLLQKPPSEWNAKERRMVKRYQARRRPGEMDGEEDELRKSSSADAEDDDEVDSLIPHLTDLACSHRMTMQWTGNANPL